MAIRSHKAVLDAYSEGGSHSQRIYKSAGTSGDSQWIDWSYAAGQPAYDARIGPVAAFTPCIASGNDAIWFPTLPANTDRRLAGVTFSPRSGAAAGQVSINVVVYDLIGYYPLIDGDSTDTQILDNTNTLPRYTSGEGVRAVLVNHVAPMVSAADSTVTYTDHAGNSKSIAWRVALTGQNKVAYGASPTGGSGPLFCNLANGSRGVRSVDTITFTTPPGGLFCIYLVKPLMQFTHYQDPIAALETTGIKLAQDYCNCIHGGFDLPKIYNGAHLGMFYMPNGGAQTVSIFGDFHFVWN